MGGNKRPIKLVTRRGCCEMSGKLFVSAALIVVAIAVTANASAQTTIADASQWAIAYVGDYWTNSYAIQEVTDGYVFAGKIFSSDNGDDFWVVKLSSNGDIQWQKAYGGSGFEEAIAIQQTSDGGYIVAGTTDSFGSGKKDFWIVKLASNGNVEWQKAYGGGGDDWLHAIQQTSDGGYIVAGTTYSFLEGWWDPCNGWILKLDANGNIEWQKVLMIGGEQQIYDIRQTSDGGYIAVGATWDAYPGGCYDLWVVKLDSDGHIQWQKAYGRGGKDPWDIGRAVQQTSDGGYVVAGETWSFDYLWVLKLDSDGDVEWQKAYSRGEDENGAKAIQQTSDGGYVVAGYTSDFGYGGTNYDVWILKLDSDGDVEWQKAYGGSDKDGTDAPGAIQQTSDGGYIVAAYTKSFGPGWGYAWILKLDSNGDIPDCCAIIEGDINVTSTSVEPVSTDVDVQTTSGSVVNTNAMARITSATPIKICYVVSNQPPVANFTYSPENPVVGQAVAFNASESYDPDGYIVSYEWDFGDGNVTNTTEETINHSYSEAGSYEVTLTVKDDKGATNSTTKMITIYSPTAIFDTGSSRNPYPSIMGVHKGTIKPNHTVIATKLYTYACEGTGGHTEYARIWNETWEATATWEGYAGDWHNISFDKTVVLLAGETYFYEIRTGSYPQIHHTDALLTANGWINCTEFTDANGKVYHDWIPAIKLF